MGTILDRFVGNISPAALLVSSFFWSWFDLVPFSPSLFMAKDGAPDPRLFIISFAAGTLFMAACVASAPLRKRLLEPKTFAALSLACGSLGTLAVFLGIGQSEPLFVAGCVLVGAYQGAGIVLVGSIATCEGTTNALVHLAAALPFNIVSILLAAFLQPLASAVFIIVLPMLPTVFYGAYMARGGNRATLVSVAVAQRPAPSVAKGSHRVLGCDRSFLILVLIVTVAFGFANYYATIFEPLDLSGKSYLPIAWRAVTSFAVLVGYLLLSWRPYIILRAGMALIVLGLALSAVAIFLGQGGSPLWASPVFIGFACFDLLIWAIMIMSRYRSDTSLLRIICVVEALDEFGMLMGTVLGLRLGANDGLAAAAYLTLGCLLLAATAIFFRSSSLRKTLKKQEVALVDGELEPKTAGGLGTETYRESVSKIAARFFLTTRETEVLSLLLAGRNVPFIAEHLHLSDNTVKTHVRHIYTKLDVHNRQELLDLELSFAS